MELDVMLYRVCVSEESTTALFLCKMGYALSYYDTVTFLILCVSCHLYYFFPQNLNCCLRMGKLFLIVQLC